MAWDYAELSKLAKANGGPEKLVDLIVNSGKKKMFPWLGAAVAVGASTALVVQKVYKYFSDKKTKADADVELAKQELIQGIKDYDATHVTKDSDTKVDGKPKYLLSDIMIDGIEPTPEYNALLKKEKRDEITAQEIGEISRCPHVIKADGGERKRND